MNKKITLIITLFIVIFSACKQNENKTETMNKTIPLTNDAFQITATEPVDAEDGMPHVDIFIVTALVKEKLLLTSDYSYIEIMKESRKAFEIPVDAVFSFSTYYAGGGYSYYGIIEDNTLNVYRKYIEEGEPEENEVYTEPPLEIYKKYHFTGNSVQIEDNNL